MSDEIKETTEEAVATEILKQKKRSNSKNYDEFTAMNLLRSKGVGFQAGKEKVVYIEPGMLGIKLLGALDYLVNHCHWHPVIRKGAYTG